MTASSDSNLFDISSLHKVYPEIKTSLKTLEMNLGEFVDDKSVAYILSDSVESLEQTSSILELIHLQGTSELISALTDGLNHLVKTNDNENLELIYAISEGVMTLNRYIEFILLKEQLHPKLLLDAINKLKITLKQPLLGESQFDDIDHISQQATQTFKPIANLGASANFLQRTFRVGLQESIKKNGNQEAIKLMELACKHVLEQVGGKFWQIAHTAVTDIENALPLTAARKRALVFVESQFANKNQPLDEKKLADLINMAASRNNASANQLRQELKLELVNDSQFTNLRYFMFGPTSEVVDTVNELIQEEISDTKDMVDTEARKDKLDAENVKKIAVALRDLSLRLYMLGLKTAAETVMKQAKEVSGWQTANPQQFQNLLSALLYAENATILMAKSHTPGMVSLPLNNTGISLHQLDTAFEILIQESRNTLSNVVNSILAYQSSVDKDMLHLANLPTMLESVGGALLFVDVTKGHKLMIHTAKYVAKKVKAYDAFDDACLTKLADIVMAADYYLESIESKQPSGDNPLIIGARSLKTLLAAA